MSSAEDRKKVIDLLNKARAAELTAIMQYMAHHYELEDADYGKLAAILKATAIEEMKHAEALAERILQLGGEPVTQPDGEVEKGQEVPQMLAHDAGLGAGMGRGVIHLDRPFFEAGDHTSARLFQELLANEEGHLDEFRNILGHIEKLGDAYLATLVGGEAD